MKTYEKSADELGGPRLPITTSTWGNNFWNTLHYVTLGYPENNPTFHVKEAAFRFMESLPFLLPCTLCRQHLADTYQTEMPLHPHVFASRQNFGTYVVNLRDFIKSRHVCPGITPTKQHRFPQDVLHLVGYNRLGMSINNDYSYYYIAIPLTLLIILYMLSRRRNGTYTKQISP